MLPFEEFFQAFTSNLLEYIDNVSFSVKARAFQMPGGIIASHPIIPEPLPLLQTCRVMVFPREEMLPSYVHFFIERAKDLRRGNAEPDARTPLSIVRRLLADYDYVDRENLCLLVSPGAACPPPQGKVSAALIILPGAATQGSSYRGEGTFTPLIPEDPLCKYGEALTDLFLSLPAVGKRHEKKGYPLPGKLSLKCIRREDPFLP